MRQDAIGKFIATTRKEKGLTQKELADQLGVNYRSVSRWENGYCMPDLSLLQELSKELEVSVQELLNGSRTSSNAPKTSALNGSSALTFLGNQELLIKKIYQPALRSIKNTLRSDEEIQFIVTGEDLFHNNLPFMWHTLLAVTGQRIILSGERQKGLLLTQHITEDFTLKEIQHISLSHVGFQNAIIFMADSLELKFVTKDATISKEIQKYLSERIC